MIYYIIAVFLTYFGLRQYFKNENKWSNTGMLITMVTALMPGINMILGPVITVKVIFDHPTVKHWLESDSKL
jgi:hypothetical protein